MLQLDDTNHSGLGILNDESLLVSRSQTKVKADLPQSTFKSIKIEETKGYSFEDKEVSFEDNTLRSGEFLKGAFVAALRDDSEVMNDPNLLSSAEFGGET